MSDLRNAHPDRDIAVIIPELIGTQVVPLRPSQPDRRRDGGVPSPERFPTSHRHQRSLVSFQLRESHHRRKFSTRRPRNSSGFYGGEPGRASAPSGTGGRAAGLPGGSAGAEASTDSSAALMNGRPSTSDRPRSWTKRAREPGNGTYLKVGSLSQRPRDERLAPGLAVDRDADLEVLDAAVGRVLAGDVEQSLDVARRPEVDDQLVRVAGRRTDELGVPDRGQIAVAGLGRFVTRGVAVGGESLGSRRDQSGDRRFADPVEDRSIRRDARCFPICGPPTWVRPVGLAGSGSPLPCGLLGLRRIRLASGSPRFTTLSAEL